MLNLWKLIDNDDEKLEIIVASLDNLEAHFIVVATYGMQFINSRLEKQIKNLGDNDFRYLTEEFDSKNLELLKQKDAYLKKIVW